VNTLLVEADIDTFQLETLGKQFNLYVDLAMGALLRGHPPRVQEFLEHAKRCQAKVFFLSLSLSPDSCCVFTEPEFFPSFPFAFFIKVGDGATWSIARAHSKMMRFYLYSGEFDQAKKYNTLSRDVCKKIRLGVCSYCSCTPLFSPYILTHQPLVP
jgi:hypothetical protein